VIARGLAMLAKVTTRLPLDPAELAGLESMSLRARVVVEGAYAGLHRSPHAGGSVEFAEHKEYAPGDDIRHLDWKVAARTDRYTVKRFEDETEMRTYLVLDTSASMGYRGAEAGPGVSKLEWASWLAAAVAYVAGQQGDPAGLLLVDDDVRTTLPPRTRPGHLPDVLAALEAVRPAGRSDVERGLLRTLEMAERRSLVLVFSDLLDAPMGLELRLRQLRTRGHDVVLFHIMHPDEVELPGDDLTHFEGWNRATADASSPIHVSCARPSGAPRRRSENTGAERASRAASNTTRNIDHTASRGVACASRGAHGRPRRTAQPQDGGVVSFLAPRCFSGCWRRRIPPLVHLIGGGGARGPVAVRGDAAAPGRRTRGVARRRLRELLLLVTRTAVAAALPIVFRPARLRRRRRCPAAATRPQAAVVVLDDSASLRRHAGGGGTVFDAARAKARDLVTHFDPPRKPPW